MISCVRYKYYNTMMVDRLLVFDYDSFGTRDFLSICFYLNRHGLFERYREGFTILIFKMHVCFDGLTL